jgi:hypothetical protein
MSTVNVSDPTKELTSRRNWAPLTPAELDALRPKKLLKGEYESPERFAYRAGISALSTIIYRLQLLEEQVREMREVHDQNMARLDHHHRSTV